MLATQRSMKHKETPSSPAYEASIKPYVLAKDECGAYRGFSKLPEPDIGAQVDLCCTTRM